MTQSAHCWPGTYRGDIAGTPATLQLTQAGDALRGVVDAGGYRYLLEVRAAGATASGTLQDPQAGGTGEASLALSGDVVEVAVVFPAATAAREIRFSFTRDGAPVVAPPTAVGDERDPRLTGTWTRNDTLRSGDATLVTRLVLVINPDGTFVRRAGETVGGGAGWGVSDGASEGTSGSWKTVGDIIHVGDGHGWQPYARYHIEQGTLMLTLADGSRELWHR